MWLLQIVMPMLRVLTRMHSESIIHRCAPMRVALGPVCKALSGRKWSCWDRDIKPENIFLTSSLQFKLGDFGLAIKTDEELPFTRSGTLDYMAPEVRSAGVQPYMGSLNTLAGRKSWQQPCIGKC